MRVLEDNKTVKELRLANQASIFEDAMKLVAIETRTQGFLQCICACQNTTNKNHWMAWRTVGSSPTEYCDQ